jgi:uncharacterized hydrophobic protein (TIGR00271 family)
MTGASRAAATGAPVPNPLKRILTRAGLILHGGPVEEDDLYALSKKVYFDLEVDRDPYVRFSVLLVLSTLIASGGVLADSTATVIGAMIVAPLMTPIMATALAMVTGDRRHLARSFITVVVAATCVVLIAWAMGLLLPAPVDTSTNSQIVARTAPRTIDLFVALACGAAGGFALSRERVSDALPGVAISISLVPPLCVVGLTLSVGDLSGATGALLLFGTNFLAILVAGGGLLALMGYGAVSRRAVDAVDRQRAALVTGVALLLILVPLGLTGIRVTSDTLLVSDARDITLAWITGSDYHLVSVDADGDHLAITIDGAGPLPSTDRLYADLDSIRPGVLVALRVVASQHIVLHGAGTPDEPHQPGRSGQTSSSRTATSPIPAEMVRWRPSIP